VGKLWDHLRSLIDTECYVISVHASERLEERGILEWQLIAAVEDISLSLERANAQPNPAVEVIVTLPDGVAVKVIWAWVATIDVAKLVTVHFFDED